MQVDALSTMSPTYGNAEENEFPNIPPSIVVESLVGWVIPEMEDDWEDIVPAAAIEDISDTTPNAVFPGRPPTVRAFCSYYNIPPEDDWSDEDDPPRNSPIAEVAPPKIPPREVVEFVPIPETCSPRDVYGFPTCPPYMSFIAPNADAANADAYPDPNNS